MLEPPAALNVTTRGGHSLNQRALAWVWMLGLLWPVCLIAADPPAAQVPRGEQPVVTDARPVKPPPTQEQKRKVVVLTSLVIAGILTVLLMLLLWIVWWSRRTHRLLRAPLPAANRGDELWYLKAKRPPNPTADPPSPESPSPPPPT